MSDGVKKRGYRSDLRQERAADTRRRILLAAGGLFVERGYAGTTIEAVAGRASVAAPTVYSSFGNKRRLLAAAVRFAVRAGAFDQPLLEQREAQVVRDAIDQREQLRLFALDVTNRLERVGPLMEVVAAAALDEPAIGELQLRLQRGRLESHRTLIDWIVANGPLRPGLTPAAAADQTWALASPEMHRLLRRERGWSKKRFAAWLETALCTLLLPD